MTHYINHATSIVITGLTFTGLAVLIAGGPNQIHAQASAAGFDLPPLVESQPSPECGRPPYRCRVKSAARVQARPIDSKDLTCLATTLYGEASGGSRAEVMAKGRVVMARASASGKSICDTVKAKTGRTFEFTTWNPQDLNYKRMQTAAKSRTSEYRRIEAIAREVMSLGGDRFTHYWSPGAQQRLTGIATASWSHKCTYTQKIGRSVFCDMTPKPKQAQRQAAVDLSGIY